MIATAFKQWLACLKVAFEGRLQLSDDLSHELSQHTAVGLGQSDVALA